MYISSEKDNSKGKLFVLDWTLYTFTQSKLGWESRQNDAAAIIIN